MKIRVFNLSNDTITVSSTTSKGNQIKWVYNDNDKLIYIKADMFGYESIAEALVSEFLHYVEDVDFVDYYLCEINYRGRNYYGCYSYNMLKSDESLVSIYRLLQSKLGNSPVNWAKLNDQDLLRYIIRYIKEYCNLDITFDLQKALNLDYITCNEDRHLNNICLIYNDRLGKYTGMSPIFDNGLSLLSDINDYPLDEKIFKLMSKVKSKPFSSSFKKQVNYFELKPLVVRYDEFMLNLREYTTECGRDKLLYRASSVLYRGLNATEGYHG